MLTSPEARAAIVEALGRIAPDAEPARADPGADLFDAFDIDSMDFLALIAALSERFCVPMPESDYPQMRSLEALSAYLIEATARTSSIPGG